MIARIAFIFLLVLLLAFAALAQITVTSANIPGVGYTCWQYSTETASPVDLGSAGANQVWNVTNTSWTWTSELARVAPASTPAASSFPTATHCILLTLQNIHQYAYYRATSTGYYWLGYDPVTANPTVFENPTLLFPLPLSYPHDSWTEVTHDTIGSFINFDSTIYTVDGWGTINTPIGSAQVIRVFNRYFSRISVGSLVVDSSRSVSYSWYDQRGIEVVAIAAPSDTVNPNFSTGFVQITGLGIIPAEQPSGPVARDFSVGQNYPNPFNPSTTLPIDLEKTGRVSVDIYDETGRLVSHQEHEMPSGTHDLSINGSPWASGSYFARVSTAEQSQTMKMTLIR